MNNTMKKGIMLLALAVLAAGGVFAQKVGDTYTLDGQPYSVQSVNGDTVTLKKVQAQSSQTFTSIPEFKTWLDSQPTNTVSNPYNVKINISDLGGGYSTSGSLGNVIYRNENKYVNLDLSGSTFTSIAASAFFSRATLTGVTIGNSVTSIEANAFSGCTNLTSVTIGNRVTSIGGNAFFNCPGITSLTIGNGVTTIGQAAFRGSENLTSVTIPNSVTSMGAYVFYCTNLTSVTFQGTIPSAGFHGMAFLGDLQRKFYETDKTNGTPGTYTRTGNGTSASPYKWTKQ